MLAKSSVFPSSNSLRSGLRILLLGTCTPSGFAQKGDLAVKYQPSIPPRAMETMTISRTANSFPHTAPPKMTDLHHRLTSICLRNPNWNDFRLLNQLRKLSPEMTLETLRRLKQDCGLDRQEAVCNILLRLLFSDCGAELNSTQLNFIHRIHPELRDRDVRPNQPGELLVYECLFVGKQEGLGRLYVHVFADMFNGWIFARIRPRRTTGEGIKILQNHLAPIYSNIGGVIQKVFHASRDAQEVARLSAKQILSVPGVQWEVTHRQFGIIKHFRSHLAMSNFFEYAKELGSSTFQLHAAFAKWLRKYNADSDFNQHRPLLRPTYF